MHRFQLQPALAHIFFLFAESESLSSESDYQYSFRFRHRNRLQLLQGRLWVEGYKRTSGGVEETEGVLQKRCLLWVGRQDVDMGPMLCSLALLCCCCLLGFAG